MLNYLSSIFTVLLHPIFFCILYLCSATNLVHGEQNNQFKNSLFDVARFSEPTLDNLLSKRIEQLELKKQLTHLNKGTATSGDLWELGKQLFFTQSLSMNDDVACVSCHHPMLGGGDGLSLSVGVNAVDPSILGPGRVHDGNRLVDPRADGGPNGPRNASSIFNLHLLKRAAFWDGRVEVIDEGLNTDENSVRLHTPDSIKHFPDLHAGTDFIQAQARFPITAIHEMFGHGPHKLASNKQKRQLVLGNLQKSDPVTQRSLWLPLFQQAFADSDQNIETVITIDRVTKAVAHYQKSLVLTSNPWFDYLAGNRKAISEQAKQGALLFFNNAEQGGLACYACHSGPGFSDEKFYTIATPQIGRGKDTEGNDHGRLLHSSAINDKYKFRTPMLLNVQITGPWSHAGAFVDLKKMIKHHFDPEKSIENYDFSLEHLSQFNHIAALPERAKIITTQVLQTFLSSPDVNQLVSTATPEQDVLLLEAFLFSLTDPCIQTPTCIKKWLPTATDNGPDGNLLQGHFASFTEQPDTYQPAIFKKLADVSDLQVVKQQANWFSDVTAQSGLDYHLTPPAFSDEYHLMGGGVAVDDFNADGWQDLFISHAMQPGKLFMNNTRGGFVDVTTKILGNLTGQQLGALFLDYDHDGDKDLLLVEDDINQGYFRLFNQLSSGAMRPSASKAGIGFKRFTHSLSAGDYDGDGDLDLFAAHWGDVLTTVRQGYLWDNSGQGIFEDISALLPQTRISPLYPHLDVNFLSIFSDIDNDNDPDLLIAADYLTSQVLLNKDKQFIDVTRPVISDENGMGSAVGDYDNDGDLDWFVSSIWNPIEQKAYKGGVTGNRLYNNDGLGHFTDATDIAGVRKGYWGWGACFADFNNDGWLDIFHTNGMRTGQIAQESPVGQFYQDPSRLFINNQDGTFREMALDWGITHSGQGRGVSCLDFDNDGDMDIIIANNGAAPTLYRNNNLAGNNYLAIKLVGNPGNPDGVGAKITVQTQQMQQLREIRLGSNYLSNDPLIAHFGLGQHMLVDKMTIIWPDGQRQTLTKLPANRQTTIEYSVKLNR
ncbi:MAG: cytochrome c peroxidase [Paraglaciecola sp.]|jgi:cytochrome c peroxidase